MPVLDFTRDEAARGVADELVGVHRIRMRVGRIGTGAFAVDGDVAAREQIDPGDHVSAALGRIGVDLTVVPHATVDHQILTRPHLDTRRRVGGLVRALQPGAVVRRLDGDHVAGPRGLDLAEDEHTSAGFQVDQIGAGVVPTTAHATRAADGEVARG